ncbi:hypothetical protein VZQ01_08945 [Myxococcus faecalis]|uniref:hypothetical protein n=1 Tax=Myxococcus TaxID=32 RepID=UPI0011426810|nr:hypothetical protein [Myxococcus sp. AB025B]
MRTLWNRTAAIAMVAALGGLTSPDARACTRDDCGSGGLNACYNLSGWKWCGITYSGSQHWTSVNVYNHSSISQVPQAWTNLNNPPAAPGNTLYLNTDGSNHSNHDIDYWDANTSDTWWGYTTYPGGIGANNCINRGGAMIQFNLSRVTADATWRLWLAEHETGHAVGMKHVCGCTQGRVMNPCTECSNPATLSGCDAQGLNALYP